MIWALRCGVIHHCVHHTSPSLCIATFKVCDESSKLISKVHPTKHDAQYGVEPNICTCIKLVWGRCDGCGEQKPKNATHSPLLWGWSLFPWQQSMPPADKGHEGAVTCWRVYNGVHVFARNDIYYSFDVFVSGSVGGLSSAERNIYFRHWRPRQGHQG